jgi:outer membrane biosynthesis protein TonB
MSSSHILLRYLRLVHLYIGVFIAPAVIFFAFTGALQTFSLHETTRGSSYKPPAWAVTLGQIHKKQTPVVPARKTPPPDKPAEKAATPDKGTEDKPTSHAAESQPTPNPAPKPPTEAGVPKPHNAPACICRTSTFATGC